MHGQLVQMVLDDEPVPSDVVPPQAPALAHHVQHIRHELFERGLHLDAAVWRLLCRAGLSFVLPRRCTRLHDVLLYSGHLLIHANGPRETRHVEVAVREFGTALWRRLRGLNPNGHTGAPSVAELRQQRQRWCYVAAARSPTLRSGRRIGHAVVLRHIAARARSATVQQCMFRIALRRTHPPPRHRSALDLH